MAKRKGVLSIQDWVICFNTYSAIALLKDPSRAKDLLAYSSLIVKASGDYVGDAWQNYDRLFRRQAAAEPARFPQWGEINPSLWTQHFGLAAARPTCTECGSRDHKTCAKPQASNSPAGLPRRWGRKPRPYPAQKPNVNPKRF